MKIASFWFKFVRKGTIANKPALLQLMTWQLIGDRALSEPVLAQISDEYSRHSASVS